jgi:N-acetylglucosaminyldiphosphoundecaprenol N-acetyl-beta-D-mannosaminyltransferase
MQTLGTDMKTRWPRRRDLFGVLVSETNYDEVVATVIAAAKSREAGIASFFAAHAVVTAALDDTLRGEVNQFDLVAPDGQPVRWALNALHGTRLSENVRGTEIMPRVCARAAAEGIPIYLYGGSPATLDALQSRLRDAYPDLEIAGAESPPYRTLTPEEDDAVVERINGSGARLVFIGLGCPKQDWFAAAHRESIQAVQLCVGAAFDFHAGVKSIAPRWMRRSGLEWFHRLCHEPRRLWKRYLVTNTQFLLLWAGQALMPRRRRGAHHLEPHYPVSSELGAGLSSSSSPGELRS